MAAEYTRRAALAALLGAAGATTAPAQAPQPEPLPSWNNGAAKKSITDFVARVTTPGAPDFVPVEARIATFDTMTGRCGPSSRIIFRRPLRSTV